MKQPLLALLLLFIPAFLFADEATHTYLVATKAPIRTGSGALRPLFTMDEVPARARESVIQYRHVDGFAADLTESEAAALAQAPGVRYIELAAERHILDIAPRNLNGQTTPYGIGMVDAPATWVATRGNAVNVAIVDTGIDYNHPDLKDQFAGGWNQVAKTSNPFDDNGHGTHVAGTIAAADNAIGVVGVAPSTHIWSVKVLNASGSGTTANVIAGVDWVITKKQAVGGNWIISESLGSSVPNQLEQEEMAKAINNGIIVVAASGNESTSTIPAPVDYPAAYPGVLAIGAVDSTSAVADFSNQGPELAFVAPGVDVLSTLPVGTGSLGEVTTASSTLNAPPLTGSKKGTVTAGFVFCKLGNPEDFPSSVKGKIALIQRGTLTFHDKTQNALNAGAIGVIIFNKDDSSLNWTLISQTCDSNGLNCKDNPTDLAFPWPVTVGISMEDGNALMKGDPNATVTIVDQTDDYGVLSGTSMATPHASGVIALVWSASPTSTPAQVINALTVTAHDLGAAGRDNVYGNGLLDAAAAAKMLNPALFGAGATPATHPTTGRPFLKRGGH